MTDPQHPLQRGLRRALAQPDDEQLWAAINGLRASLDEAGVREAARILHTGAADERWAAAAVLGTQLESPVRQLRIETLTRALPLEDDPEVLESIVSSLGWLKVHDVVPELVNLSRAADAPLRLGIAKALVELVDGGPSVVHQLRSLAGDPDAEVREWASFGLTLAAEEGRLDSETTDALAVNLEDQAVSVRFEAAVALGLVGDSRAIPLLADFHDRRDELSLPDQDRLAEAAIRAAAGRHDPRLRQLICSLEPSQWQDTAFEVDLARVLEAFGC